MVRRLLVLLVAVLLPAETSAEADPVRMRFFQPPRRPPVPAVRMKEWVTNPIDAFVLARLEAQGLTPSDRADKLGGMGAGEVFRTVWKRLGQHNLTPAGPADKRTLIRRATFDLIGLPPTP